jgi:metal-responsive CopG/Arc/MetJ family transcriptional regulator
MIKKKSAEYRPVNSRPNSANLGERLSLVTVVLPEVLIKQLDALAKRRTWARSEAVAHAISNFINAQAQRVA